MHVITRPERATPEWLTEVLRRCGMLDDAQVTSLSAELVLDYNSQIFRLTPIYSVADHHCPPTLILKLKEGGGARDELAVAHAFEPHGRQLPMLVRWYDAAYSPEQDAGHFLMADLAGTHFQTTNVIDAMGGRSVPPEPQLTQMIDTIARFHAYWWQRPELGQSPFPIHRGYRSPEDHENDVMRHRREEFERFFASAGADLAGDVRQLYAQMLARLPQLYERYLQPRLSSRRDVTLIHGDCYFGQFFCPKDSSGQVYLMDLESANTFLGAMDLAFMFATFWTPQQRHKRDRERRCLERYHQQLAARGVDFTFDDLLRDYRVAIAMMIFYAVWDAVVGGSRPSYWRPKMDCLLGAFRDHQCESLFA